MNRDRSSVAPATPPWEGDDQHEHDPDQPPGVVKADEVDTAARLGPEVVPAPAAFVSGFDLIFVVRPHDVRLVDEARMIPA
jgi:hypothetical protein